MSTTTTTTSIDFSSLLKRAFEVAPAEAFILTQLFLKENPQYNLRKDDQERYYLTMINDSHIEQYVNVKITQRTRQVPFAFYHPDY